MTKAAGRIFISARPRASRVRVLGAAVLLALAGCANASGGARYAGALPGCGLARSTLDRHGDGFVFTPGEGVLFIRGTVAPDGSFTGTLNTQPASKPPFVLTVHGRLADDSAEITYTTPRCTAEARFTRTRMPLL